LHNGALREKRHSILESEELNNQLYHNDDSSIMNTQTIEHRDEEVEAVAESKQKPGAAHTEEAA
jgi:hypothetical protein